MCRFSQTRPQLRLQHEATCRHMTVTCHWAGEDTCAAGDVSLKDIEDHLLADHGDLVAQVDDKCKEMKRDNSICLGGAGGWGGCEAEWGHPDATRGDELAWQPRMLRSKNNHHQVVWHTTFALHGLLSEPIIWTQHNRALGHRFLLFLRSSEKMRDDYDLAVAILGPPQLANRSYLDTWSHIHAALTQVWLRVEAVWWGWLRLPRPHAFSCHSLQSVLDSGL